MTKRQNTLSKKTYALLTLFLVMLLSISMLFVTACGSKKTESERKAYNVKTTENDEQVLANGNFEYGTADVKAENYPYSTSISWSKSYTNAVSSSRSSGIISTTDEDYAELCKTLYEDDYDDYKEDAGESAISFEDWCNENHPNPKTHDEQAGKVLMIYNYNSTEGKGTAQKYTSSTTLTVKKNTYAKVSVWVKTANLNTLAMKDGVKLDCGANINLTNTLNGVTQDQFQIKNINANDWTQYSIYVEGNDVSDVTLKLVLGLGYNSGSSSNEQGYVEGQAFFDDAVFEEISKEDYEQATASKTVTASYLSTASSTALEDVGAENTAVKFSFLPDLEEYRTDAPISFDVTVNGKADAGKNGVILENVEVEGGKFYYITFSVKTALDKVSTGLNVYAVDQGTEGTSEAKFVTVKEFTNVKTEGEDAVRYSVLVINEFEEARTFTVKYIIGPTDVNNVADDMIYPTGTVSFSDFDCLTGNMKDGEEQNNVYAMLNSLVDSNNVKLSLKAPNQSAYTEETETEKTYPFAVAYTEKDAIKTGIAKAQGLYSMYNKEGEMVYGEKAVNSGLVNTDYFDEPEYTLPELVANFDLEEDESYQPLMIGEEEFGAFGYYFYDSNMTVASNTFVKVTVQVKVVGDAEAYIYIVNTTKSQSEVFNPNKFATTKDVLKDDVFLKVTDTTEDEEEFKTVTFYLSAGKTAYDFRVELWNGSRDNTVASRDLVFFNSVEVTTGSESDFNAVTDKFESKNHIDVNDKESYKSFDYVRYTQALNEYEVKYNKTCSKDDKVEYTAKAIYLKTDDTVLVRLDTLNPVLNDPATQKEEEETPEETKKDKGCTSGDSATFWLSFSSILLALIILLLIVFLIVRKIVDRVKAKKSGAVQSYDIQSRNKVLKDIKSSKANKEVKPTENKNEEVEETPAEEETTEETPAEEEYTYGEVTDFNTEEETAETTEETPAEENAEETPAEEAVEEKVEEAPAETTEETPAEEVAEEKVEEAPAETTEENNEESNN